MAIRVGVAGIALLWLALVLLAWSVPVRVDAVASASTRTRTIATQTANAGVGGGRVRLRRRVKQRVLDARARAAVGADTDADADVGAGQNAKRAQSAKSKSKRVHRNWRARWGDIKFLKAQAKAKEAFANSVFTSNANTNRYMHWLRDYARKMRAGALGVERLPTAPLALIGPAAINGGDTNQYGYNNLAGVNKETYRRPQTDPLLTHAHAAMWGALADGARDALLNNAGWWANLAQGNALLGPVVANNELANCDPTLIRALAHAGTGNGNERACAIFALNAHGGNGNCPAGMDLTATKAVAGVINAGAEQRACMSAAHMHYARLTVINAAPLAWDMWCLRGTDSNGAMTALRWLYGTERANGDRVTCAVGVLGDDAAADDGAPEDLLVSTTDSNGVFAMTQGKPGDKVGRIWPQEFGGPMDPLNIWPTPSITNRLWAGPAEKFAAKLKRQCGNGKRLRWSTLFTYNTNNDRRPNRARTVVDLLDDCSLAEQCAARAADHRELKIATARKADTAAALLSVANIRTQLTNVRDVTYGGNGGEQAKLAQSIALADTHVQARTLADTAAATAVVNACLRAQAQWSGEAIAHADAVYDAKADLPDTV